MTICRFEIAKPGSCRRGESCYFSHNLGDNDISLEGETTRINSTPSAPAAGHGLATISQLAQALPAVITSSRGNPVTTTPCTYYLKGRCAKGQSCRFSHAAVDSVVGCIDGNSLSSTLVKIIDGLSVTFGDGAKVEKLSLPQDFSTVSLTNLPPNTTASSHGILSFLQIYADPKETSIKLTCTGGSTTALVTVQDPKFADKIFYGLDQDLVEDLGCADVQVSRVPTTLASGASTQRVNFRTVLCTWDRPVMQITLSFYDIVSAHTMQNLFDTGIYKIEGQSIRTAIRRLKPGSGGTYWHVYLRYLPTHTKAGHIERLLSNAQTKPFSIEAGDPSYDAIDQGAAAVKAILATAGPIESFALHERPGSRNLQASVTFHDETVASTAASTLNDAELPFGNLKLRFRLNITSKTRILTSVYDALKARLDGFAAMSNTSVQFFRNNDASQRLTTVMITSADAASAGLAKQELDTLLKGQIPSFNHINVWHPSFNVPYGRRDLQKVEVEHKVLIIADAANSRLRIYGTSGACEKAAKDLSRLVKSYDTESIITEIPVHADVSRAAMGEAYAELRTNLVATAVGVDLSSTLRKIVVKGTAEEGKLARKLVSDMLGAEAVQSEQDCCVCWTEADKSVATVCGHLYCGDCFENMCLAGARGQEDCSIHCQGASGVCQEVITLSDLHKYLSSTSLEAILKSSLETYVRLRHNQFRPCPTRNCGQLYRVASDKEASASSTCLCLKCLNTICIDCHACHGRISCQDWKYVHDGGDAAFEKAKRDFGFKDCPNCKTAIEKTMGCNHMVCGVCNTHICWVCQRSFETSDRTYEHLREAHGGYGL